MSERLFITHLNARGEGIASYQGKDIPVPYSLPGEIIEADIIESKNVSWAKINRISQPSQDRIPASCPHYQVCGGCALQHVKLESYRDFKKQQVVRALTEQKLATDLVEDPVIIGPQVRRRIDFMARKFPDRLAMGFYEKNNRRRIDLRTCLVVDPRIEKLFEPLFDLLGQILNMREETHIFILAAENGVDLLLAGFKRDLTDLEKEHLISFAQKQDLVRLTYKVKSRATVVYERQTPYVCFSRHKVEVNPNVFLQTSAKADVLLAQLVCEAIPEDSKRIADLFCGRGTFSVPLTEKSYQVDGFEGDQHAITALEKLALPNLNLKIRDLFAYPLQPKELQSYDAVVLNPPRSGVKKQVFSLAEAEVPLIVYVSCNPETFAIDVRELVRRGYQIQKITPVDQFMWSPHVEVVGILQRTE